MLSVTAYGARAQARGGGLGQGEPAARQEETESREPDEGSTVSSADRNEREITVEPIVVGEIRFGIYLLPAGLTSAESSVVVRR
jgi:hypothetical protein